MKKLKVAVLFGGASSEHEVSRMSATSVLNNLDAEKYDVLPVGITKDGRWYLYSGPVEGLCSGAWERHSGNVPAAICPGSGWRGGTGTMQLYSGSAVTPAYCGIFPGCLAGSAPNTSTATRSASSRAYQKQPPRLQRKTAVRTISS